jgi:hypothetical protein
LLAGPTPKSAVDSAVEPEPEVHPLLLMPAAALMKVTPESQRAATLRLTAQVGAVEPESNNEALILQQRIQELEPHAEDIHSLSIIVRFNFADLMPCLVGQFICASHCCFSEVF